ncbi:polyamine-modulated factor 1-binding protein 1 isoform X2 [Eretmochelys imbricata]
MKALGKLELEVQRLRQDTAAEVVRKQLEVAKLQQLIQTLECKLRESRRLCAQREQVSPGDGNPEEGQARGPGPTCVPSRRGRQISGRCGSTCGARWRAPVAVGLCRRAGPAGGRRGPGQGLRQCWSLLAQVMQSREEQLRQAQAALQETELEGAKQRAEASSLDGRLRQAQQEREQSRAASGTLQEESQLLRQRRQDSQQQQQAAAQELVQQEERLLLAQSSLQSTQEQLSERVAEVVRLEQASRRWEAEQLSSSMDEVEQSRKLLEHLKAELSQWKQRHRVAVQQGMQHQHSMAKMELKLGSSQEQAKALQQQLQEQASTQRALQEELSQLQGREEDLQRQLQRAQERESRLASEREALQQELRSSEQALLEQEQTSQGLQCGVGQLEEEGQRRQEQLRQCCAQLESTRSSLGQAQQQIQQQASKAMLQESALAQLQAELEAAQARERQSTRTLTAAETTIQELMLKTASCQEKQREALKKLSETAQDMAALRAELVRTQAREAQLEEQMRRLNGELKTLQDFREQEVRSFEEQLGEQRRCQEKAQALAQRDEELVVFKVELAALKEKLHGAAEERDRLQQELHVLRQKFVASSNEAEALRSSLGAARSDSRRLHCESELVLANVTQWVKEQKQANDKLGHKIREQIKHIAQLTGEKELCRAAA